MFSGSLRKSESKLHLLLLNQQRFNGFLCIFIWGKHLCSLVALDYSRFVLISFQKSTSSPCRVSSFSTWWTGLAGVWRPSVCGSVNHKWDFLPKLPVRPHHEAKKKKKATVSWNLFAVEPIFQVSAELALVVCELGPNSCTAKLTSLYPSKTHTLKVYNTLLKRVLTCTNMQRWQWPVLEPDDQVFLIINSFKCIYKPH